METQEEIRRILSHYPRWDGVGANVNMVYDARLTAKDELVRETIERLGRSGQLAVNADYAQAYRTFFNTHPELTLEGNMSVLDAALAESGEAVTAENLEDLLQPGHPYSVLSQLSITAEAEQSQAEQQEWNAIIAELIEVKTFIDSRGRRACYDELGRITAYKEFSERIKAMSLEDLRRIRDSRAEVQRLRGMSVKELQQVVRDNAPATPSRYELIPPQYVVPGKDIGINWSFQLLRRLPSQETARLIRMYGNDQVTAACAARGN